MTCFPASSAISTASAIMGIGSTNTTARIRSSLSIASSCVYRCASCPRAASARASDFREREQSATTRTRMCGSRGSPSTSSAASAGRCARVQNQPQPATPTFSSSSRRGAIVP
eukprot:2136481-Pleurochrysis_carterae.AAC.1